VIEHDGFRIIARKDGDYARLYSRTGQPVLGADLNRSERIYPSIRRVRVALQGRGRVGKIQVSRASKIRR
jgi:hypothetical protein